VVGRGYELKPQEAAYSVVGASALVVRVWSGPQ
jgi:hypothetical protein